MGAGSDGYQGHARKGGSVNERGADVVSIPDKGKRLPLYLSPLLLQREDIGKSLAGVFRITETIDHRYGGLLGQLDDRLMGKGSGHDAIKPSLQIAGHIGD